MNIEKLSPIVNTEVNIPEKMFDALCLLEIVLCARGVNSVSQEEIKSYLKNKYDNDFAESFDPKYMISNPAFLANQR